MADPFKTAPQITPEQIIDILLRGKWIIIIPLCISLTIGLAKTLTSGKTYEASTMILVQPQRVPTNYVRSVVTSTINQRLSTISQQILSRSNIEKIIDQFGLFEDAQDMYLEDKIAAMRKRINVQIERARQGAEAFSITFKGSDPQRVMRIANTLASYFMDENLKVREAQAVGTSEFLDSELEKTRKRLEEREQKLAAYRAKYLGGLPDELDANLRTLDRLQENLIEKNTNLRDIKNSLNMLQNQIAQSREMASQSLGDPYGGLDLEGDISGESENAQKLAAAKEHYENLLLRYKEKHPDVLKVKKSIEKLEQTIAEEKKTKEEQDDATAEDQGVDQGEANEEDADLNSMPNFAAMQQDNQLRQLKSEMKQTQSEISDIQRQMKLYQQRVEDTPKRELELQALKRDYRNIQEVFNSLLDRKLEAELSVNMEKKQKGEQFRILDHARLPEKPISPNVKLLFLLSVAAGLGFGGGIILLKEIISFSVIRSDKQIEDKLGLNIIASVPIIKKKSDKLRARIKNIIFAGCCFYAVIFLGFFALLNSKGIDRTINFIKTYINI